VDFVAALPPVVMHAAMSDDFSLILNISSQTAVKVFYLPTLRYDDKQKVYFSKFFLILVLTPVLVI
jgi:hypothetical protein